MNVKNLTISEISNLLSNLDTSSRCSDDSDSFFEIGKAYFIRCVTYHSVGIVKAVKDKELLLTRASWVAESGRFHDALKYGFASQNAEIEPFINDVIINRDSIVDATVWTADLPAEQK